MKIFLPLLVLAAGIVAAWAIVSHSPEAKLQAPPRELPQVRVMRAEPRTVRLNARSQGIVTPRVQSDLVSEVAGRVVKVAPSFAAGGFFKQGEVLVVIDPRDYEFAITKAQVQVAEARRALLQEQAEVEQARRDWKVLGEGKPTDFALRKPHLTEAQAKLAAAEADLKLARLNLERTKLHAPFDGRVREKKVDVGQYVTQGSALAQLYAVDIAEVRLPITRDQLAYLDLPLSYRDMKLRRANAQVRLTASLAGQTHHWDGRIVRTEGALDEKTGMLYAIAQVQAPYSYKNGHPPLFIGLFVQAEIIGQERHEVFVLPQTALRSARQVLVLDTEQRIQFREVEVLRSERDRIFVSGGLKPGERVVLSALEAPVEGMQVRVETGSRRSVVEVR